MMIYMIRFIGTFVIFGSIYIFFLLILRNYVGTDNPKVLNFLIDRGKKKYNWYNLMLENDEEYQKMLERNP